MFSQDQFLLREEYLAWYGIMCDTKNLPRRIKSHRATGSNCACAFDIFLKVEFCFVLYTELGPNIRYRFIKNTSWATPYHTYPKN